MFAGNSATSKIARQIAAGRIVEESSSPSAHRISSTPLIETISPAAGKTAGTMRIRSYRPTPMCGSGDKKHQKEGNAKRRIPVVQSCDAEKSHRAKDSE